ncbi:MAG: hypothetical protein KC591_01675 [Gemmatimonadetes bacterium]|nr:hypothetical protein [Gemmatimonadota bacterium]
MAALLALSWAVVMAGCERDKSAQVDRNRPPDTFITEGPESSADPRRPTQVFYQVHLYWRGEDVDGSVAGFRFAIDDTTDPSSWSYTTKTDSVFRFSAGEVGAKEHLFLIRAVDNEGKQDASPDTARFESFTVAPPTVAYDTTKIAYTNADGSFVGLSSRDTVLVNSTVTLFWTGSDADGEVVGWESIFRNQLIEHDRNDTTRTIGPLASGEHELTVRAVDDAGAKSTSGGLFVVVSNFDPKTTIDPASIRSRVVRPWLTGPDTLLEIQHFPPGGPVQDTIPFGASLAFDWDSEDRDGPVVSYTWSLGFLSGETMGEHINTDSLVVCEFQGDDLVCDTVSVPLEMDQRARNPLVVRGKDIYNRSEGNPIPVNLFYNLPPTVVIADSVNSFPAGTIRVWFQGDDRDSDPRNLQYSYRLDDNSEVGPFELDEPESSFVQFQISPAEFGAHRLIVRAFDQSLSDRPSVPDTLDFSVSP